MSRWLALIAGTSSLALPSSGVPSATIAGGLPVLLRRVVAVLVSETLHPAGMNFWISEPGSAREVKEGNRLASCGTG